MRRIFGSIATIWALAGGGPATGLQGTLQAAPSQPPKVVPAAPVPKALRVNPPPNSPSPPPAESPKPALPENPSSPAPPRETGVPPPPAASDKTDPAPAALPLLKAPDSASPRPSALPVPDFRAEPPPLVNGVPRSQPGVRQSEERKYLGVADALFNGQQWEAASVEYRNFIQAFPKSSDLSTAYYRLAECQRKLNNPNAARLLYEKITLLPPPVAFSGPAAYRLAESEFEQGDYSKAYGHFKRAAQEISEPLAVKQSAQFFAARSLHLSGRKLDARAAYRGLAEAAEDHPFREASQFHFAVLAKEAGRAEEALPRLDHLALHAKTPAIRIESLVRAALFRVDATDAASAASGSPKSKEALRAEAAEGLKAVEKALDTPGTESWHPALRLGALRAYVTLENPEKVIETFPLAEPTIEAAHLPEALLLLAGAQRQLKRHQPAVETLERIIRLAPDGSAAATARYERLISLYNLESPALPEEVGKFLSRQPKPAERDKALLMKAEFCRMKEKYADAASAYSEVVKSKELSGERKQEALLRWSECAVLLGDVPQTVSAVSQFLAHSPDHSHAPTVLLWRAELQRRAGELAAAETDFQHIIDKYPKAKERETALVQLAPLLGAENKTKAMADCYEQLLKDYPQSAACADAHHWVGRAAFEAGDYAKAAPHFNEAKTLSPQRYFESDSLAAIYCVYHTQAPDDFWKRVQEYAPKAKARVPSDMLRWCARHYLDAKEPSKAEPVWSLLCSAEDVAENDHLELAKVRFEMGNYPGAESAVEAYLKKVDHPSLKARGILLRAKAELARGAADLAQKTVEQIFLLQPEGSVNGEARILVGDILAFRQEWEAAAKAFAAVAVALDDERLTPTALEKSMSAYRSAGREKEASAQFNKLQSRFPEWVSSRGLK